MALSIKFLVYRHVDLSSDFCQQHKNLGMVTHSCNPGTWEAEI